MLAELNSHDVFMHTAVCTLLFKSLGSVRFFKCFQRVLLCSPRLHLLDQKYYIVNIITIEKNCFIFYLFICINVFINLFLGWQSRIFSNLTLLSTFTINFYQFSAYI